MTRPGYLKLSLTVLILSAATSAQASSYVGQVDTFSTGVADWHATDPKSTYQPIVSGSGGPTGPGDHYLLLNDMFSSGDLAAGVSLANNKQWATGYQGVPGMLMEVSNFGPTDLYLNLLFETQDAKTGTVLNAAITKTGILLKAGEGWEKVFISLNPSNLTSWDSIGTVAGALKKTTSLQLVVSSGPTLPLPKHTDNTNEVTPRAQEEQLAPLSTLNVGFDDIQAIPEPSTVSLMALAGAFLLVFRKSLLPHRR
jgi:hypothetical protein